MLNTILLANLPQLLISITYFLYNQILTSMLAASEYSSYSTHRKPLRVTHPEKNVPGCRQRGSYWLSIPYRYSIPLLITYGVLHWLISQSLFFVYIVPYDMNQNPITDANTAALGYSPIAIIFAVPLGGLMVLALLVLGFGRRLGGSKKGTIPMPLAGSCSAVISAACHPPADDTQAYLGSVMWGEIMESSKPPAWAVLAGGHGGTGNDEGHEFMDVKYAHLSFTSQEVCSPSSDKLYA